MFFAPTQVKKVIFISKLVYAQYLHKSHSMDQNGLKGVWHEVFNFRFLHESVSPRPPSILLEPFWIFSKISGDICALMFITGVNDTGDKLFSGVVDTGD